MLIGNKKDKARREVSYKVAAEYARKNNFGLIEVSAKTGSGVNEAFARLILEVHQQIEAENDPDKPQLEPTSEKIAIVSRPEIHSDSFGITRERHYSRTSNAYSPRNDQVDFQSYMSGS
jgi:predicted GTPase